MPMKIKFPKTPTPVGSVNGVPANVSPPQEVTVQPTVALPIGPPPTEVVLPEDYEGYVTLCKKVAKGERTDKALVWATLAQAEAQKEVADHLDELLDFLGARAGVDGPDGKEIPNTLGAELAGAIVTAVHVLKDQALALLPPGAKEMLLAQLAQEWAARSGKV